jgi:hypothetical protein
VSGASHTALLSNLLFFGSKSSIAGTMIKASCVASLS